MPEGMSTRVDVMVGAVGLNPASVLVSARAMRPARAVLVHTTETIDQATALRHQLEADGVTVGMCARWAADAPIETVRAEIATEVGAQPGEAVAVDITGATKPLGIGLWQGLSDALGDRVDAVYLAPTGILQRIARRVEPLPEVVIEPAEVLAWYGAQVRRVGWEGCPREALAEFGPRRELTEALCRALAARHLPVPDGSSQEVDRHRLPAELPPGFDYSGGRLVDLGNTRFLGENGWLEELCLLTVADALRGCPTARLALELTPEPSGGEASGSNDEMDVVAVCGASVLVVEAKARRRPTGAGPEIQKRAQKARRFLGTYTKVAAVVPIWADAPPSGLTALMGRTAQLVAGDLQALSKLAVSMSR